MTDNSNVTRHAEQVARQGCILRGVVGSTVHGLANAGTDDRDEMGICIEPPEYVLGLRPFDHWVSRSQPEGAPSGPGDLDLTIDGLRKYCRMALKGSPTVLLLLFIDGEHVLERNGLGVELQALAPALVSKRAGRAFVGYVDDQRRGLLGQATWTRELSAEHGLRGGSSALERAMLSDGVAEEPDRAAVDAFLVDAYRRAWADRG
jgi:hypothetical protein